MVFATELAAGAVGAPAKSQPDSRRLQNGACGNCRSSCPGQSSSSGQGRPRCPSKYSCATGRHRGGQCWMIDQRSSMVFPLPSRAVTSSRRLRWETSVGSTSGCERQQAVAPRKGVAAIAFSAEAQAKSGRSMPRSANLGSMALDGRVDLPFRESLHDWLAPTRVRAEQLRPTSRSLRLFRFLPMARRIVHCRGAMHGYPLVPEETNWPAQRRLQWIYGISPSRSTKFG